MPPSGGLTGPVGARRRAVSNGRRRAPFLVVAVDLNPLPYAVDVVGVAAGERLGGRAVLGVDHEDAADRGLAVIGQQGAGGDHVDIVAVRLVEVDAVRAVEFRPRRHPAGSVGGVDHEQHRRYPTFLRLDLAPLR